MRFDGLMDADVIVVGGGLAGLVTTAELARAGGVLLLDQEPEASLGGQAFWSFGGLFLVGSPEQHRMGVKDSRELAWQDWMGSAFFDRGLDDPAGGGLLGYRWARAYVDFASGEKRSWLHAMGVRWFPVVGWAERGGYLADGHGNSVPRFHVTWGTGPGVVEPFERQVGDAVAAGVVEFRFRHRVDELTVTGGAVDGVRGAVLEPSAAARDPQLPHRDRRVRAARAGGDHRLRRHRRQPGPDPENWPERIGPAPGTDDLRGARARRRAHAGHHRARPAARLVNRDRMWHYTEGIQNWDPIWARHGIRILPGPSSLWLDARDSGSRRRTSPASTPWARWRRSSAPDYDYSWFVLNQKIIEKEFALSGSEQNPDLTGKDIKLALSRVQPGAPARWRPSRRHGADFVVARTLAELVKGMNGLTAEPLIDLADLSGRSSRGTGNRQPVYQGPAGDGDPQRPPLPRRPARQDRRPASDPRPRPAR